MRNAAPLLAILTVVAGTGCAMRPLVERTDPHGRSLVLVVDASASMRETDPNGAAIEGASLAAALAGQKDNVGVIAFNVRATPIVPLRPNGNAAMREMLRDALAQQDRSGSTDFVSALDTAYAMLEEGQAGPGSSAIVLTDGLPTGRASIRGREFSRRAQDALAVPPAVARFAAKRWRIFSIAFGPDAPETREYLASITAPTEGVAVEAKDAAGLMAAFEAVSVQALGYLSATRVSSGESVSVPPESRRFAFLSQADAGDATLRRDAKDVEEEKLVRFPRSGPSRVALLEDPAAGSYSVSASGLVLLDAAWQLVLEPGSPPATVEAGTRVPVSARIAGEADAVARLKGLRVEVEVSRQDRVLSRGALVGGAGGTWTGAFVAPPDELPITVTVSAIIGEGGRAFTSKRSKAVLVRKAAASTAAPVAAPTAATLAARPSRIDLAGFAGDPLSARIEIEGDAKVPLAVEVTAPGGVQVSPARFELAPGGRSSVEVRAGAQATSGSVVIAATPALAGIPPVRVEVPVRIERGSVTTSKLDLGTVTAGEDAQGALEASGVTFGATVLKGPNGAKVPLTIASNKAKAATQPRSPAGSYEGVLEARCGSASKKIPVLLQVVSKVPETLTLSASWGWASTTFEVGGGAAVKLTPTALAHERLPARLDPELDLRTAEVAPGKFELRVFAPASAPVGRYKGMLKAEVGGVEHAIVVVLEVKR